MLSFHNDPAIKEKYLTRVRLHAAADEIIKGVYWQNGKGCAVGCSVHSADHSAYETGLGIPQILARLEDRIFEGLPNELAKTFPEQFLDAIPVGKDLSKIWPQFAIFLLTDPTQCASRHPRCDIVANKYREELNGQKVDWKSAADAAYAAAADAAYAADAADAAYAADAAAYAAADAAAAYAAYAAYADAAAYAAYAAYADAAAYAAADAAYAAAADAAYAADAADAAYAADAADAADAAAYAAADADAAAAARQKCYIAQSEKLLQLLKETV
jgi:hypothetical protein